MPGRYRSFRRLHGWDGEGHLDGLIWLQQADCLIGATPVAAAAAAAALGDGQCNLSDRSSPGDWRLPTKAGWAATIAPASAQGCRFSLVGGLPSLTSETSQGCFQKLEQEGSGDSLSFLGDGDFNFIGSFGQGFSLRVWPVRNARQAQSLR